MATIQPFKMLSDDEREALLKEINYHKQPEVKKTIQTRPIKVKRTITTSDNSHYINNSVDNPFANFCKKAVKFVKDNVSLTFGVGDKDGSIDKTFGLDDIKDIVSGDKELKTNISIGPVDIDLGVSDIIKGIDMIGGGFRTYF